MPSRHSLVHALFPFAVFAAACSSSSSTESATEHDAGHTTKDAAADTARKGDGGSADAMPLMDVFVTPRMAGQRTPLSAACDPVDTTRCLLPWPSNTYTIVDSTTPTGLRVHVSQQGISATDTPDSINRADGFSRVSPIETAFPGTLDPTTLGDLTTGSVRLIVQQPGSTFGQLVPMRFDVIPYTDPSTNLTTSLLIAYPRVPLAPDTDYAVVVMNSAHLTDGTPLSADREAQVALGLSPARTDAEGALYAYDAPARQAMTSAGVDPKQAVRVWDFTTRSLVEPTADLTALRSVELAAYDSVLGGVTAGDAGVPDAGYGLVDAGPASDDGSAPEAGVTLGEGGASAPIGIAIDSVDTTITGTVQMAVKGRIRSVPYFLTATGSMNRDSTGAPVPTGVHDVPFRIAIPVGTGDYRIVMYGHGTGGTYDENSFDEEITQNGAAKIGTQFIGWTASTILNTFTLFSQILQGTEISAAGLSQSLADTAVVQHALGGALGAALGEATLAGIANPAVGRHPNVNQPIWAGGSLGGTMGFVYTSAETSISAAVLNVPGAAWSQFVTYSYLFNYVRLIMQVNYPDPIAISMGVVESQINFDPIDGANWYDAVGTGTVHPLLLEQESMGDPVLPNIGNEMVATASHADQVGVVLNPIVTCSDVSQAPAHNGMTQFKVPSSVTAPLQIHGFAANDTPAGIAAQQQIVSFIASVWAGAPLISIPPECVANTPANSCDFSAQ